MTTYHLVCLCGHPPALELLHNLPGLCNDRPVVRLEFGSDTVQVGPQDGTVDLKIVAVTDGGRNDCVESKNNYT